MAGIEHVTDGEIRQALARLNRQHDVEDHKAVIVPTDPRVEIGVIEHEGAASLGPRRHRVATQHHYVVSGWVQCVDLDSGRVYDFRGGDFYAVLPGTAYAQRLKAGTRVIRIQVPTGEQAEQLYPDESTSSWLAQSPRTSRADYFHIPDAPAANSLCPAVAVALFDDAGRVLMLRRADNDKWTLPGGTMELTDYLVSCAVREVKEETGFDAEVTDLIGT